MDVYAIRDYCINSALRTGAVDYGVTLDYGDGSVSAVAEILSDLGARLLRGEIDEKRARTSAHIFGVFVGELLRCNHLPQFQWRDTEERGLILIRDEETIIDPVAAALSHIKGGGGIAAFYDGAARDLG